MPLFKKELVCKLYETLISKCLFEVSFCVINVESYKKGLIYSNKVFVHRQNRFFYNEEHAVMYRMFTHFNFDDWKWSTDKTCIHK